MAVRGRITVTSGPDRGKGCELSEELVRIGKGPENELILSDPTAADTHVNILQREGRFAVSTQVTEGITVEGNPIPADRWVWLPELALIQVTRRTALEFQLEAESEPAAVAATPQATASIADMPQTVTPLPKPRKSPAPVPSPIPVPPAASDASTTTTTLRSPSDSTGSGERMKRKRTAAAGDKAERKSVTARFITDGPGDPLVKLGEDGHLPELRLEEGKKRAGVQQEAKKTNPIWLILIMAFGFGMSILLLFVDLEEVGSVAHAKAEARRQIQLFSAQGEGPLKPYQERLRQALQAHSRRDFTAERQQYRRVLEMLRSEGKNAYTGVTGTPERDQILERQIGILLKD